MDDLFVIKDNPSSLEELEQEKEQFDRLTYRQRKLSNDESIKQYGLNNLQRYEKLKAKMMECIPPSKESTEDPIPPDNIPENSTSSNIVEASVLNNQTPLSFSKEEWELLMVQVKENESIGLPVMILSDREKQIEEYDLDDLKDLTDKFNDFNAMSRDLRLRANETATNIFGIDNFNLYTTIKNYVISKTENYLSNPVSSDISDYRQLIRQENNLIGQVLKKIDIESELNESQSLLEQTEFKWILENSNQTIENPAPSITPFFTPDEMESFGVFSGEINLYADAPDNLTLDNGVPISEWFRQYKSSRGFMEDTQLWYNKLRHLYSDYNAIKESGDKEKLNRRKQSILELGWNPELPFDSYTQQKARERIGKYINEKFPQVIDLTPYQNVLSESLYTQKPSFDDDTMLATDMSEHLRPIYIVLVYRNSLFSNTIKAWLGSEFSHVSLGLRSDLSTLYTFGIAKNEENGRIDNGFIVENIDQYKRDPKCKIMVNALFVTKGQYFQIVNGIRWFEKHKGQTKYAISNLFNIMINRKINADIQMKMVCSQFIDAILRIGDIVLVDKSNNTVTPKDLELAKDQKLYTVYKGNAKDYDQKTVLNITRSIINNIDPKLFAALWRKITQRDDTIPTPVTESNYYDQLKCLLTPTSIFTEKASQTSIN